jgi:periplasmic divalent cation tolerance protein
MGAARPLSRASGKKIATAPVCDNPGPMTAHLVFCTCPDAASAERIADALVTERLAACVNLLPGVASVYRWQGQVERAVEVLLLIKTSHSRLQALIERIPALHPHELPEVLAVPAGAGLPAYLDWVNDQSREET